MSDSTTTLAELKHSFDNFLAEREWHQFHSPAVDSKGVVVESAELLGLFLFSKQGTGGNDILTTKREAVEDELADVFIWLLCFSLTSSVDIASAVSQRLSLFKVNDTKMTIADLKAMVAGNGEMPSYTPIAAVQQIVWQASLFMHFFSNQLDDEYVEDFSIAEDIFADTVIAVVTFATVAGIDVTTAFTNKRTKNALKYPVEKAKGKALKYTDL